MRSHATRCPRYRERVEFSNSSQSKSERRTFTSNRWVVAKLPGLSKKSVKSPAFSDAVGHTLRCELAKEVLRSSGTLTLQVTGWSMLPTIFPGDRLVIERNSGESPRNGDIVLVSRDDRLFAHRLVRKGVMDDRLRVWTQGDSMVAPDPPVDEDKMLGKVSAIMRDGKRIRPRRTLRIFERAVAALVQRSDMAGRVVVGVHSFRRRERPN